MAASTEAQVARLDERLNSIDRTLAAIAEEMKTASEGRKRIYEAQEQTARDLIRVNHRLDSIKRRRHARKTKVDENTKVTKDVGAMRERVIGAGVFGRWSIRVAVGVVTFGGWLAAVYTWVMGRPPP